MKDVTVPTPVKDTFDGGSFERRQFSVAPNKNMFRTFVDTLYTNKARAILRELWTNAFDSHVQAGVALKPFLVHLPTEDEPTFYLRDYGISIKHEDVMDRYSKMFDTTKDGSNAVVGHLGIGSKAPLSYTDSFTVTCWLDGWERIYLVSLPESGIPEIMHLGSNRSVEPTGMQVSFPVREKDFEEFTSEAVLVARGFNPPPDFLGEPPELDVPLFSGANWRIFETGGRAIRQGCVIYTITREQMWVNSEIHPNFGFVADVPIGTVEHTANREALSLDDTTKKRVTQAFADAERDFIATARSQVAQAVSLVEAQRAFLAWRKVFARVPEMTYDDGHGVVKLNGFINLSDDPLAPEVRTSKSDAEYDRKFNVDYLNEMIFIIDKRDRTVPRRLARLRQYRKDEFGDYDAARKLFLLPDPTQAEIDHLKARLCLRADQLVPVASLPDVASTTGGNRGGSRAGTYTLQGSGRGAKFVRIEPADMLTDCYWVGIEKGTDNDVKLGHFGTHQKRWAIQKLTSLVSELNLTTKPIYFLTPQARKKLNVSATNELVPCLEAMILARKGELIVIAKQQAARTEVGYRASFRLLPKSAKDQLFAPFGITMSDADKGLPTAAAEILGWEIESAEKAGVQAVRTLKQQYPLLFSEPDAITLVQYIEQVRSAANAQVPVPSR